MIELCLYALYHRYLKLLGGEYHSLIASLLSYSPTTPLAIPLDDGRANICCRPGHRVSAQDHRLAAALNYACERRSPPCNAIHAGVTVPEIIKNVL